MAEGATGSAIVRARIRVPPFSGLARPRLAEPLLALQPGALGVVVAPAGSGKTTLLAEVARQCPDPVAWLTLDASNAEAAPLLAHLAAALGEVAPLVAPWAGVDEALAALERLPRRVLLVLDDVHSVSGHPGEAVVAALAAGLPPTLRLIVATRAEPGMDVSRRRLAHAVIEIDAEDLRFRTWEVDGLFRDHFGVRLGTDEVPRLTRLTEGWAAGLQLFHLATEGRPRFERNRLLHKLGLGTRFAREYLTSTVLDTVSPGMRRFLVRTAVFDELTPHRCDLLLATDGSGEHLAELARRGLFTFVAEDRVTYRYHDVLRSYLLDTLVGETGETGARALHRRAGEILERTGAVSDAIRSYSRAEDWEAVRRLLGDQGASLADDPGAWIDALPVAIRATDPWVLLAVARRLVTEGSLERARQSYRQASERLRASGGHRLAQAEQRLLDDWLRPDVRPATSWVRTARRALVATAERIGPAGLGASALENLGQATALLVSGDVAGARARFTTVADRADTSDVVEVGALLGRAVTALLAGDPEAIRTAEAAVAAADLLGYPVLCRVARAAHHGAGGRADTPVEHLLAECELAEDRWGAAIVELLWGLGDLAQGRPAAARLHDAERRFASLGAPVLEDWSRAAGALAARHEGRPLDAAARSAVERAGRRVGLLPHALALQATADDEDAAAAARLTTMARGLAARAGATPWWERVTDPAAATGATPHEHEPEPVVDLTGDDTHGVVAVRCLGAFTVEVDGTPLELGAVRPRHLQLLKLLALHGGRTVHREELTDRLWPTLDAARGAHSLQVAVSALRRVATPEGVGLVERDGDGYRLALGLHDRSDVRTVEEGLDAARRAARRGDRAAAAVAYTHVIDHSRGDLLPELGPEEWVVEARDRLRLGFGEACLWLADDLAAHDRPAEAAQVAHLGLERVPAIDGLWRRAITSLEAAGDHAAAQVTRAGYGELLHELGVADGGRLPTPL